MTLVGARRIIDAVTGREDELAFYGGLFQRLTAEVKGTGSLTRYVGFQSPKGGSRFEHFFGIEVERIQGVPEGMVGWELGDHELIVYERRCGRDVVADRRPLEWRWREPPVADGAGPAATARPASQFPVGEFSAGGSEWWASANAYVRPGAPASSDDGILIADYDPAWPARFQEMAAWLRARLGPDTALRIEHFGSTSVPGLPAKPVIDIMVEVPSFLEAKRRAIPLLCGDGWEYWWSMDHMFFLRREGPGGVRTHHVHMAPRGHLQWRCIAFRDHLRLHPEEAARYAALKRELARAYGGDRERYTDAKAEYIGRITGKAIDETGGTQ